MAEARFLAAADLHLGRPIASLPEAIGDQARSLGPFGALDRLVDVARSEAVDAVLIAGDLVDDDGAYFEVLSALQQAVRRLDGIPLITIAGNHDANLLPRLASAIDGLFLIGAGGRWSSHVVQTGVGEVNILGWSFPDAHCRESPFTVPPPPRMGRRIGMLHGDLDASGSVYAPFTSGQLREHAADAWLLGHVHAPQPEGLAGDVPKGYLGSICGLDPSEAGPRGAWLVRCDAQGTRAEHVPIAPLAWVRDELDATTLDLADIDAHVHRRCDALAERYENAQAVGVRLAVCGEHQQWREFERAIGSFEAGRPWEDRGRRVFLNRIECRVVAPLPLERLAEERSAAGRIAGLILALQAGGADELVRSASAAFSSIGGERNLRAPSIGERKLTLPDARETLLREARAMLGALVAQDEEAR